jgi:hypothetical protein
MKIDFNKHTDHVIMEELVRARLFKDAALVVDPYPDSLSDEDVNYQNKVFQAYAVVLDYMTLSSDKRMKIFKDVL